MKLVGVCQKGVEVYKKDVALIFRARRKTHCSFKFSGMVMCSVVWQKIDESMYQQQPTAGACVQVNEENKYVCFTYKLVRFQKLFSKLKKKIRCWG